MFKNISGIFNKSNKDLRKRIYFTLFCLGIFCLGTGITIPWASALYEELGFLEIFNLMSGGGLRSFSIFALGVSPYITASIITQILQMDILPYFKELKEQGYTGRQKINKITRYLGIIFAFVQAYVITVFYMNTNDTMAMLKTSLVMTAGTSFLLWIGDQITNKGIGNGQSLLIMAGILQSMPTVFSGAFKAFVTAGKYASWAGIALYALFILVYILIIVGIIWITLAERRIQIQYANHTAGIKSSKSSYLPIKINSAGVMPVIFASILLTIPVTVAGIVSNIDGVMPVIFASILLTIPVTVAGLIGKQGAVNFINKYIVYTTPTGFVLYCLLILLFGYFWTFLQMNPEELAKDLNKRGGYIPGIRPGSQTVEYVSKSLSKLTLVGSIFLVILAGIPIIFSKVSGLSSAITIGGTGILIVVGVAIETYKQIESGLVSRNYGRMGRRK